jgi:hypothetical protein
MELKVLKSKRKMKSWDTLMAEIKEAKNDPEWRKELREFIKITTS